MDLGVDEYRVAVEYDGEHHKSKAQQAIDAERWNAIHAAGWAIRRVTGTVLMSGRATLLEQIASELRARGWRGAAPSTPMLDI